MLCEALLYRLGALPILPAIDSAPLVPPATVSAVASTRLLGTLLFNVKAVDPLVFAAMSLMMIAMGVLASYMPARRASSVDPIEALRSD